jgi:hypothetical protein
LDIKVQSENLNNGLAYAAASAIAFSRVTTGAHFPADGSAHGFVIARYDVLHGQ